jgi:biotin carboxylase
MQDVWNHSLRSDPALSTDEEPLVKMAESGPLLVLGWSMSNRGYVVESLERNGVRVAILHDEHVASVPHNAHVLEPYAALYGTADVETVANIARESLCAGIITFDDELTLLAASVAEVCGFAGPPPESIVAALGKAASRTAFVRENVASVPFRVIRPGEALPHDDELPFPWVVKPGALSGGDGVYLVRDQSEARTAVARAMTRASAGVVERDQVLVEEYIDGPNLTVELAVGSNAESFVIGSSGSHYILSDESGLRRFREKSYACPASFDDAVLEAGEAVAVAAVRACGLRDSLAHVELRLSPGGWKIIEVNPRAAGAYIPEMILRTTGVDYIGIGLAIALRAEWPSAVPPRSAALALQYIPVPEGIEDGDTVALTDESNALAFELYRKRLLTGAGQLWDATLPCVGLVMSEGRTVDQATRRVESAAGSIRVSAARPGSTRAEGGNG